MSADHPLAGHRYLSLATFRKNGRKVATPVWFAEDGGSFWVFTARDSGKVKRLRNSSRAEVAPCDVRGGLRGEWVPATATLVDNGEAEERAYRALRAKYGWQMALTDLGSRLTGKIGKRKVVEVRLA
ncbi:MAG TPA: PPOX class F420-dependent oxidoreductase [Thermoanaerobaculia bacterium]|nr:PPOX class F420-dependent oxidoreductase [Thermoanaerobaculia bacterium]